MIQELSTAMSCGDGRDVIENQAPISPSTHRGVMVGQEIYKQESYNKHNNINHSLNKENPAEGLSELIKKSGVNALADPTARETLESIISQMYLADFITVGGVKIPQPMVRKQLDRLDEESLSFAYKKMCENPSAVSRGSKYMMACIYNAASEFDLHVSREVAKSYAVG